MINLHNYSHYSLLESILKPKDLVGIAVDNDLEAVAITDINSLAGAVQLVSGAEKAGIKPIIGITLLMSSGATIVLLAMNQAGYDNLLQIIYHANDPHFCTTSSTISLDRLKELNTDNLICLTGHDGSSLHQKLVHFTGEIMEENIGLAEIHIGILRALFGDRLYIQIEPHFTEEIISIYQNICQKCRVTTIHTNQIRYLDDPKNKYLFDIVRATHAKCKIKSLRPFEQVAHYYQTEGVSYAVNQEIVNRIEPIKITRPPSLPKFVSPNGDSSYDYVRQLCWNRLRVLFNNQVPQNYIDRIGLELTAFKKEGLEDYFLILSDIVQYARSQGNLIGPGRGSASGCLLAYLLNITGIDPIQYGLIFERFWNPGRAGSMPDIDVDFPKAFRQDVITYITNKYGDNNVGQVATYQTLMGKAALKAVLRAEGNVSFQEMNDITNNIYDKAKIADELEEMKQEGRAPSVVLWALENRAHKFNQWVELADDQLTGPLAGVFANAIALEGVKSAIGKHPSGIVIGSQQLHNVVPMIYDSKLQKRIVGMEYEDAEKCSLVKLDILGISTLDKLMDI